MLTIKPHSFEKCLSTTQQNDNHLLTEFDAFLNNAITTSLDDGFGKSS